jgi:RNA polymerase sigma factor (sigma-70 family)
MSRLREPAPNKDQDFARVVAAHRNAILRYGLRRLDDRFAAEDLVAETFIVVWRRFDELPTRDEELFWLYAIARRVLANLKRSQQRSLRLEMRLSAEREAGNETPRYSMEDIEALMEALGSLSESNRELIQLAYWEKLSYRELGVVLGCSEKAAGIRLTRARQSLRERLNQSPTPIASLPLLQEEM